jgi:hypothetical protein
MKDAGIQPLKWLTYGGIVVLGFMFRSELIPETVRLFEAAVGVWNGLDRAVFAFNSLVSGWTVSVDAVMWFIPLAAVLDKRLQHRLIVGITFMHAICGYLGLYVVAQGEALVQIKFVIIFLCTIGGMYFIVNGLKGDEESDFHEQARKLAVGLWTLTAALLLLAVSNDEFFAVLQRYQWMLAQGWDHTVMALNIFVSMCVLYGILYVVRFLLDLGHTLEWIADREDGAMFCVFSLIMYYMVRAWLQNYFGYTPWEIPYTGIAPDLLIVGFVLVFFLKKFFESNDEEGTPDESAA